MQTNEPLISKLRLDILVENSSFKSKFLAEHGLSVLINAETEDNKKFSLLFDTGSSGNPLPNNLEVLKKDLSNLDGIILSHGHYDHSGGLMHVFKLINRKIPLFLHSDALNPKYSKQNGKTRSIGIPSPILEKLKDLTDLQISKVPQYIHPSIFTSGQIERKTFEKVPARFHQKVDGNLVHDNILDDQALVLRLKTGIVIICGCSHSGIINTIKYAIKITGSSKINLILGGFHLIDAKLNVIEDTMNELKKFDIDLIGPNHCSGLYATTLLVNEYLGYFREMHVGDNIVFE
ncbi:MAG: MBL fold metallo-hydrolase [Candidatus Helarchaeota archaeon]|nr:MBL fold metallo-hydrolase [Candidatus Helarchaeota archaeon]